MRRLGIPVIIFSREAPRTLPSEFVYWYIYGVRDGEMDSTLILLFLRQLICDLAGQAARVPEN